MASCGAIFVLGLEACGEHGWQENKEETRVAAQIGAEANSLAVYDLLSQAKCLVAAPLKVLHTSEISCLARYLPGTV